MTSIDAPLAGGAAGEPAPQQSAVPAEPTRWDRFEAWLGRRSDGLNPILVKEARQALRSRQFTITFFLMLAAGWTWSIMGLAMLGPAAYYNATGPSLFYGYYFILAAPLLVVIPYSAYSSLAAERQDRTYELVSITALDAGGILVGKLCGIGMQMLCYLSALFPCLAFTYLLRGLDIFTVLLVVFYTCLLSLGLALGGLLLATLSPPRQRYVIVGVLFAIGLFWAFGITVSGMNGLVASVGFLVGNSAFWEANVALALLYGNAVAIAFLAARSQLTAVSQNRSTALRLALSIAHFSAIGWFAWAVVRIDDDFVMGLIFFDMLAWMACGVVMVGEKDQLSPRVKRSLPRGFLGRTLSAWYMPGSGTGLMFVLSQMIVLCVAAPLMVSTTAFQAWQSIGVLPTTSAVGNYSQPVVEAAIVGTSYVVIYLGLTRLVLLAVRRYEEVRLSIRFLTAMLLLMFLGGGPWVIQITNPATRGLDYTLWQTTNPLWTMMEYCFDSGPPAGTGNWLFTVLPIVALCVWTLNLPSIARQLHQDTAAKPARVDQEDRELAAAAFRPTGPQGPWDPQ